MSAKELIEFYTREIEDAKDTDIMLSLHLKATMMKVSDPILFGHCVKVFFKDAFDSLGLPDGSSTIVSLNASALMEVDGGVLVPFGVISTPNSIADLVLSDPEKSLLLQNVTGSIQDQGSAAQANDLLDSLGGYEVEETLYVLFEGGDTDGLSSARPSTVR